ncbi:unnamed protein product [Spirodela intermedia]|uniref:Uncharacterized protein n=2 Tax=Spirodela intermedia TaxID=51605 RepID=A0A7I8JQI5_SPIIN|nr:unnamed protein product [Spirodela intermedia]CAA6672428.1 unnamed protein product [Spirodela intermedia]CAA7409620.1 unnamed protein product [Spirodela intermedia]
MLSPLQQAAPPVVAAAAASGRPVLTKQVSQKMNCLCSPTTHAGSFRCRHHRGGGASLLRSGVSVGSGLSAYGGGAADAGSFSHKLAELAGEAAVSGSATVRV